MAVYTEVSDEDLKTLATAYDFGEIISCKGISEGIENSNYLLQTSQDSFILTLYERRVNPNDLPFFMSLMDHYAKNGVPCPVPLKGFDGQILRNVCGKPAAITSFLRGNWPRHITEAHCAELGPALARLHKAGINYDKNRENNLSIKEWRALHNSIGDTAENFMPGLKGAIESELDAITSAWPDKNAPLMRGIIHADLFPDNVFFINGKCTGLIDFYFACTDFLAYDIAICLNAWCFDSSGVFNTTKANRFMSGYQSVRRLAGDEKAALPLLARGAAMRFLLTRLYDWINPPLNAYTKPKDPQEFLDKLNFHRGISDIAHYGIY
ncbi:MAG TPA: homoserine kinase [Rhodospirillaceae bacterium]|nr:homoserine kinase [Rhodospirillaceae bacterium]